MGAGNPRPQTPPRGNAQVSGGSLEAPHGAFSGRGVRPLSFGSFGSAGPCSSSSWAHLSSSICPLAC